MHMIALLLVVAVAAFVTGFVVAAHRARVRREAVPGFTDTIHPVLDQDMSTPQFRAAYKQGFSDALRASETRDRLRGVGL